MNMSASEYYNIYKVYSRQEESLAATVIYDCLKEKDSLQISADI